MTENVWALTDSEKKQGKSADAALGMKQAPTANQEVFEKSLLHIKHALVLGQLCLDLAHLQDSTLAFS